MKKRNGLYETNGTRLFAVFNYLILIVAATLCLLPLINVLAVSFSDSANANANLVGLWPKNFQLKSYELILSRPDIQNSIWITVKRTFIGVILNLFITISMAYPLSKKSSEFPGRNIYMVSILFVMLFSGGLVPLYILVKNLGLIDSIWSLILPGAVPIFNIILMMNYFRNLPHEMEEAAKVDGANTFYTLIKIIVPLSMPVIAAITLFQFVSHWNDWFAGLIFMNKISFYPLQTLLQTTLSGADITNVEQARMYAGVSDRTLKAAQIFVTTLPILIIYPFLQRFFAQGIVLGAVKG